MISKTEMLAGLDKVHPKMTTVLHSWILNEANNVSDFISNPSAHVNYNEYVILDYSKLQARIDMLNETKAQLVVITEYKEGNPDYTRSMYESAIDFMDVVLLERLHSWLVKRHGDMSKFISSNGNEDGTAPVDEYKAMFKFNGAKFMEEYMMYATSIEGSKIVIDYKKEQIVLNTPPEPEPVYDPEDYPMEPPPPEEPPVVEPPVEEPPLEEPT